MHSEEFKSLRDQMRSDFNAHMRAFSVMRDSVRTGFEEVRAGMQKVTDALGQQEDLMGAYMTRTDDRLATVIERVERLEVRVEDLDRKQAG